MLHPVDTFHLKVALPGLLLLAGLTAFSVLDLPYCWAPSHFTGSQVAYTRNTCGKNLTHPLSYGWGFPKLMVNILAEAVISVAIYLMCCHVGSSTSNDLNVAKSFWERSVDEKSASPQRNKIQDLLCSSKIAVLYFLVQLLAFSCWLLAFFLIQDLGSANEKPLIAQPGDMNSDVFICEFTVRRLGNVVRYGVQCEPPTYNFLKCAISGNKVLCLLMAIATVAHIVFTFFIAPWIQRKKVKLAVEDAGLEPVNLEWGYGLTDLYMTTVLSPSGFFQTKGQKNCQ